MAEELLRFNEDTRKEIRNLTKEYIIDNDIDEMIDTCEKLLNLDSPKRVDGVCEKIFRAFEKLARKNYNGGSSELLNYYDEIIQFYVVDFESYLKHTMYLINPSGLVHFTVSYGDDWMLRDLLTTGLGLLDKTYPDDKTYPESFYTELLEFRNDSGVHNIKSPEEITELLGRFLCAYLYAAFHYKKEIDDRFGMIGVRDKMDYIKYCKALTERLEEDVKRYVTLYWTHTNSKGKTVQCSPYPKNAFSEDTGRTALLLEGTAGTGKTFFLEKLAWGFAKDAIQDINKFEKARKAVYELTDTKKNLKKQNNWNPANRSAAEKATIDGYLALMNEQPSIPVFIALKNIKTADSPITGEFCHALGVKSEDAQSLLRYGRFVLLLDGYDEIKDPDIKIRVHDELLKLISEFNHLRIIVTNRADENSPVPLRTGLIKFSYHAPDDEDILEFIKKYGETAECKARLNELMGEQPSLFRGLSPLKLSHFIQAVAHEGDIPEYPEIAYLKMLLDREREKKHFKPRVLRYCLQLLACGEKDEWNESTIIRAFSECFHTFGFTNGADTSDCLSHLVELGLLVMQEDAEKCKYCFADKELKEQLDEAANDDSDGDRSFYEEILPIIEEMKL